MGFNYKSKGELVMLTSDLLEKYKQIEHFYSTKKGGTGKGIHESMSFRYVDNTKESVHSNFAIAAEAIGGNFDDVVRTQQVHKSKVSVVRGGSGYRIAEPENDGLVTNIKGVILSAFYADCQVVMFFDPINNAIGICHSGWRGTALNISENVIDTMEKEYGTKSEDLIVTIGPAICQKCFECDIDVYEAFVKAYGKDMDNFFVKKGVKYHPNIGAITKYCLMKQGVIEENIDVSDICTYCDDNDLYWSHRKIGNNRGVHGGFIRLK